MPDGHVVKSHFSLQALCMLEHEVLSKAELIPLSLRAGESQRSYFVFRLPDAATMHADL